MDSTTAPVFTALSTSARQLYHLLRCISFNPKAEVQITPDGLRFTVEEARVISGNVLLSKDLFSSYTFGSLPRASSETHSPIPRFQISLSALLETLAIFSVSDTPGATSTSSYSSSYRHPNGGFASSAAFNTPALHLSAPTCALTYPSPGSPLRILISDPTTNITTTCDLTTYSTAQSDLTSAPDDDIDSTPTIPLDRAAIVFKAILRAAYLADAISELAATQPDVLAISASATSAPYFQLEGEGGPFGDATVDFMPFTSDADHRTYRGKRTPLVTETFSVGTTGRAGRVRQKYKFELVRKAGRAMASATKVSVRVDRQGVLSLQFMVGVGGPAESGGPPRDRTADLQTPGEPKVCFVEYRFVPLVDEDEGEDGADEEEGEDG